MRTSIVVAVALAATGCLQGQHDPSAVEVAASDCYTCHQPDYEATTDPPHAGDKPTTCGDCHATSAWMPALEGGAHPETAFPISGGPHGDIACTDCHVPGAGTSAEGADVSCIGCHTGEHERGRVDDQHDEVARYQWEPERPAFCRDCHARGRQ